MLVKIMFDIAGNSCVRAASVGAALLSLAGLPCRPAQASVSTAPAVRAGINGAVQGDSPEALFFDSGTMSLSESGRYQRLLESVPEVRGHFDWATASKDSSGVISVLSGYAVPAALVIHPDRIPGQEMREAWFDAESNIMHAAWLNYSMPLVLQEPSSEADFALLEICPGFLDALPGVISAQENWVGELVFELARAREGAGLFGAVLAQYQYLRSTAPELPAFKKGQLEDVVMFRILLEQSPYAYGEALAEYSHGRFESEEVRRWLPGSSEFRQLCSRILESPIVEDGATMIRIAPSLKQQLGAMIRPQYPGGAVDGSFIEGEIEPVATGVLQGYSQRRALEAIAMAGGPPCGGMEMPEQAAVRFVLGAAFGETALGEFVPLSLQDTLDTPSHLVELGHSCREFFRSQELSLEWKGLAGAAAE